MKNLFVQPAAGDAGGAVGVAHYLYNTLEKQPRGKAWTHAYLGPDYTDAEIAAVPRRARRALPARCRARSWCRRRRACSPRAT